MRVSLSIVALLATGCQKGGLPKLPDLKEHLPRVSFHKLQVDKVTFEGAKTTFVLNVDNPHPIGLDLAALNWKLAVSGTQLLDGTHDKAVKVEPNAISKVRLPVAVVWADIFAVAGDVKGRDEVPWGLTGEMAFATPVGNIRVPYDAEGNLPVLHVPKFQLEKLRVEKLDLLKQTATLALDVGMRSDQGSALTFDAFDYGLKLAGSEVASGAARVGVLAETGQFTLPVDLKLLDLGKSIVDAITNKSNLKVGLDADANVVTPLGPVPLKVSEATTLKLR